MNYGKKLKETIAASEFSQNDIAPKVGVTPQGVSSWTKKSYPPLEAIETICKIVNIPVWEFFIEDTREIFGASESALHLARRIDNLPDEKKDRALKQMNEILDLIEN